jgi:very-short-patch-repair endonuclease
MPQQEKSLGRARALRRRMTKAERKLWAKLRNRGLAGTKFRRQVPIGPFIVDFVCIEKGLIIEIDGGQHAPREYTDGKRTRALASFGYRVVRFWNNEVLNNRDGVLARIASALVAETGRPHPNPLPHAGEGGTGGRAGE